MQRKLIEVYSQKEFKSVQYFITTHSNHLLDITLDFDKNISTYSFKKESDKKYLINNRTDNKDILDML
jgi:predicted ATP-dependent endonuclease of OLD family